MIYMMYKKPQGYICPNLFGPKCSYVIPSLSPGAEAPPEVGGFSVNFETSFASYLESQSNTWILLRQAQVRLPL